MNKRHAYLIMAHHKFEILKEVLRDLDDERNDIFLHVDIKAKNYDPYEIKAAVLKAKLYLTDRMDVRWGGYTQIACIMMLLKEASKKSAHSYYHFMVGVEFPLKSQQYIHDFFDRNQGYEFIGFDYEASCMDRIQYYHPFNSCARNNNTFQKILNKFRIGSVFIQKVLHFNRVEGYDSRFMKGYANWSITHSLVCLIISKEEEIRKIYRHSFCGDEIFIHTIVYNSEFWDKVYDKNDEYHSAMRITTWKDPYNQFHVRDVNLLLGSNRLFARKIDGDDAIELIHRIKKYRA